MAATTIAITSAATAQATAANLAAQEAARKACMALVRGYENDTATVEEMRQYAGCIDKLHPAPMEGNELIVLKVVVLVLFLGVVVGIVREWRDRFHGGPFVAVFMGSILGFSASGAVLLMIAACYFGAVFLFS